MSREQEELVSRAARAVNEGDIETIVAMTGPDAEYELVGGFADLTGQPVLRGPEGMRRFYTDWFETFRTTHVEPKSFLEAGDRLLLLADLEVTTRLSPPPRIGDTGQPRQAERGGLEMPEVEIQADPR